MRPNQTQISETLSEIDEFSKNGKIKEALSLIISSGRYFKYLREKQNNSSFQIPQLLLIGPARTGTTWIKSLLIRHPDILMFRGEPNVLWGISRGNLMNALQFYANHTKINTTDSSICIISEKSPGYISLPDEDIKFLSKINPDMKIITGKRNETIRMWSFIKHRMSVLKFSGTWKQFATIHQPEIVQELKSGNVDEHLKKWKTYYNYSQIYTVNFSDILNIPEILLNEILMHINARPLSELSQNEQDSIKSKINLNPNPTNNINPPDGFDEFISDLLTG